jgi:hypothetical protein
MDAISEQFTITIPDKGKILQLAFAVVLFYKISEAKRRMAAIVDVLDEHCAMTGNQYRWTQNPQTKSWKRLKEGINSYIHPREWVLTNKHYNWSLIYHSGEKASDASDVELYSLNIGDQSEKSPGNSFVRVHFPLTVILDIPAICERIRHWSAMLQPDHGYAGFSLVNPHDHGHEHHTAVPDKYTIGQRFPGVDVYSFSMPARLGSFIRGADWLTILSDAFLERIGGLDAVKKHMGELPVLGYAGGAILQAGDMPQLGDNEQNLPMTEYRQVAAIVEPLRLKDYKGGASMLAPDPKFTNESYREWMARFSPQPE